MELTLRKPFFLFSRRIFGFYKLFGHKLAELQALRASRIHLAGNAAEMNPKREAGTDTGEQEIKVAQDQNKWFRSFASQADREREEMFCNHYRGIGIQAVAAAKCLRNNQSPTAGTDRAITANTAKKQN